MEEQTCVMGDMVMGPSIYFSFHESYLFSSDLLKQFSLTSASLLAR